MPKPFRRLSIEDFSTLLARFRSEPGHRRIDTVHMHHTWKPNHAAFRQHGGGRKVQVIEAIYNDHTGTKGWSDIAQHVTIDPEGGIWTGRNLNQPPVSASGHNGNRMSGPFMFEMIGNFDRGHDELRNAQLDAVLHVIVLVQLFFDLPIESLRFHSAMSGKTCPGSGIDPKEILNQVSALREKLASRIQVLRSRSKARNGTRPFGSDADEIQEVFETVVRNIPAKNDPMDADPDHRMESEEEDAPHSDIRLDTARAIGAELPLNVDLLHSLRPHVVNLHQGRFSEGGIFNTSADDVDAIFNEHLPRWLGAQSNNSPKRVLFYAHGGLVNEANGLRMAAKVIEWWKQNNVYPIFFVWETGFLQALGQILRGTRERVAARNFFSDNFSDPALETVVRQLGGEKIWSAMKFSAERSVEPPDDDGKVRGGAHYVAQRLKAFCNRYKEIELHAVGHSAGSIFHSHFIPTALKLEVPAFRTLHLLAPALRVDAFREHLMPLLQGGNSGIERISIFTMSKDFETADNTGTIYRKSLLYLIHHALERDLRTPILGLETSLRSEPDVRDLFGLGENRAGPHDVVWSVTSASTGINASQSRAHGGFDNDRPTMESVMRRVLNTDDATTIVGFPDSATRAIDVDEIDEEMFGPTESGAFQEMHDVDDGKLVDSVTGPATQANSKSIYSITSADTQPVEIKQTTPARIPLMSSGSPILRALCVGINEYSVAPLRGCVADAELWARTLHTLGFETTVRIDKDGTYDAIVDQLGNLITSSRPGDVVVFQFAGHGTHLRDLDGDEKDTEDEALVPFDFQGGRFLLDDDQWNIYEQIPDGVNVTSFYDCCHSGTMARVALASIFQQVRESPASDVRVRFMDPTRKMEQKHQEFRSAMRAPGRRNLRDPESMRAVVFSACQDNEVALEKGGSGDFTRRATALLPDAVRQGITHEEFQMRVTRAFGARPAQNPSLDCATAFCKQQLLLPLQGSGRERIDSFPSVGVQGAARRDLSRLSRPDLVVVLRSLADALERQD